MKVAILTQPLGHNYGGLLQAYALQSYLKSVGCEVQIINRRTIKSKRKEIKQLVINSVRLLKGRIKTIPTEARQASILRELTSFRDHYLAMSPAITDEQQIRDFFLKDNFDVVVVGSDQVWRPRYSPSIKNFYLDFLNDIDSSAKRLAYAASFGVDAWEYTPELTLQCKALIQRFDAISVREQSGVGLCSGNFSVTATCTVDPTLLLEPSAYDVLINKDESNNTDSYLFSYVLDPNSVKSAIISKAANARGIKTLSILPKHSMIDVTLKEFNDCRYPSVESWLKGYRNSDFVVTDSFHGTVFSILFNKPFIAVGNAARGMARFESLLSQLGLQDRLVESEAEVTEELLNKDIDWDSVNAKRVALVKESQDFLRTHLFAK
ncbi:MAG: polysaccharide pyruvyl transferase family protein [Idiomarina sp.]|nr:polysaccharide pyruvyl transferase family protein [Idiomarina sp.]